ncbi:uncharacterized protein C17orf80 homolog isoform X2 [Onychomys torridus]|nr:uncharacterized protein C17orf80 homolog isoform X2 [Onychomys torridus]XP_036052253.1 uncharacterized protein C17orf80 homolog isoform X2 [Onychomys torridus]XP_036052254.1 uncharacterized protein C17orf80 homolog isoform X2 [Onychomys torridus]XP_036052255.1 uncharacterized protein C17orf80 homolog isoform X2 [Onychomys torridus]XP_036052256.1 uncharacterized protein C17orf80 homolog isoform X2 [Onychomys torridus]XP_036052257.1 uncharacterized protein C17orf80 homolog isoform X2 [Onychom
MGDAGPRMEVCPYCKKPFKRLKTHLPHCKMISADQKAYQSKPATLSRATKEKRPTKDLTKARRKGLETESARGNVNSERGRSEWTAATFPQPADVLERASTAEAGGETRDQNQPSFQAPKHVIPKVALQRVMTPQARASDAPSPEKELDRDVTGSKGSPCHPSETKASVLVGSMEPVLSSQDRTYSSAQPHTKPSTSASLKLDTLDPPKQKLLAKFLGVPVSDCHSPKNGSHGVQRGAPSVLSRESSSRDGGHLSGVSPDPANAETQQKSESLLLGLHTTPLSKAHVREHQELRLGAELCHRKGNTENSMSATEVQEKAYLGLGGKDPISPTKAKAEAALALLDVFTPPEGTSNKLLSIPESGRQCLASLAVKSSPEDKTQFYGQSQVPAIPLLVGSKRDILEPTSFRQPHAAQTGYHIPSCSVPYPVSRSSLISHVAAADSEAPPRSVGLEWFPELYPGYVGLGVLPRGPQHWNSASHMPPVTSQGASVSKVPWLGRSSADSRNSEPLAHTTSSFPLPRLLGAVHKGWVRCSTTIKKSSVGGLTVLFAGYFILCCSWSFKQMSKPSSSVA